MTPIAAPLPVLPDALGFELLDALGGALVDLAENPGGLAGCGLGSQRGRIDVARTAVLRDLRQEGEPVAHRAPAGHQPLLADAEERRHGPVEDRPGWRMPADCD